MRTPPRNSDGTLRRANQAKRLTNRSIIAAWVEAETLHMKRLGMGYHAIAEHLISVARGQGKALVPVPAEARFSAEHRISMQAVYRAFRRPMVRLPDPEAAELRKLDSERLEAMFFALQAGMRQGDAKAVDAGVRGLAHKARLNGYEAPRSVELGGQAGGAIPIEIARRVFKELDYEK
jgi:hypothetical protein